MRSSPQLHPHPHPIHSSPDSTSLFFQVTVKDLSVSAGAGFIVVSLGTITFIPGLPIKPAYYHIDLDLSGSTPKVVGLS